MRHSLFLFILISLANALSAQYVYTIRADSVQLTNCDSSELIIANHTQNVPGFLFNTGNGRTVFKRGVVKVSGGLYLIGADTLNLGTNAWLQGGNTFGTIGVLGTKDNNHVDFYTNNIQRSQLTNTGNLLLGTTLDDGNRLQVGGNMFVTSTDQAGIINVAWNSPNGNKITIGSNTANNPTIVMGLSSISTHPNAGNFTFRTPAGGPSILALESGHANGALICSGLFGANAGTMIQLTSEAYYSAGGFSPTSGTLTGVRVIGNATSTYLDFNSASGNATYNMLQVDAGLNTSGTYSGIVRGLYYSPLLKSITGVDHRAIETVTGNVMLGTTSGNVIIGSTTDAGNGYRLQTNGSAYITPQLKLGSFVAGSSFASSGASLITQGQVRASGGFNLRDPISLDNGFSGMASDGGWGVIFTSGNAQLMKVNAVQGATSGNQISILGGFNPISGNGTVNVLDFSGSHIAMIAGSNSITYNYLNLSPVINQGGYGTGTVEGFI